MTSDAPMKEGAPRLDWLTANQRYLMAAVGVVQAQLAGYFQHGDDRLAEAREKLAAAEAELDSPAALETLRRSFALSEFERARARPLRRRRAGWRVQRVPRKRATSRRRGAGDVQPRARGAAGRALERAQPRGAVAFLESHRPPGRRHPRAQPAAHRRARAPFPHRDCRARSPAGRFGRADSFSGPAARVARRPRRAARRHLDRRGRRPAGAAIVWNRSFGPLRARRGGVRAARHEAARHRCARRSHRRAGAPRVVPALGSRVDLERQRAAHRVRRQRRPRDDPRRPERERRGPCLGARGAPADAARQPAGGRAAPDEHRAARALARRARRSRRGLQRRSRSRDRAVRPSRGSHRHDRPARARTPRRRRASAAVEPLPGTDRLAARRTRATHRGAGEVGRAHPSRAAKDDPAHDRRAAPPAHEGL